MKQPAWMHRPAAHQIAYPDHHRLASTMQRLKALPPLVFPGEIEELKRTLVAAEQGRAFVLHGGDCVERFADCRAERIADRLKILLQMSVVLTYAARTPVVRIGRMAGQFFKPRSSETETIHGVTVPTYRGDPVHAFAPSRRSDDESGRHLEAQTPAGVAGGDQRTPPWEDPTADGRLLQAARTPRADRLIDGYFHAAATLNYIRAMIAGGFADLHHPHAWDLDSMRATPRWEEYRTIVDRILDAIHFMESFGGVDEKTVGNISFFTSHEALHLPWEEALTRGVNDGDGDDPGGGRYNLSAHTVWLGARTAQLDGAHVAYLQSIDNPIGIKVSPSMTADALRALLAALNPRREAGRITLITRLGRDAAARHLPPLIQAVRSEAHPVIWSVDPMHGNTETTSSGRKTRRFEAILEELETTFAVHRGEGSRVQGVHFELTGDDVTECTGGSVPLEEADLERNYESWCDPRLNYTQSMETAFRLAHLVEEQNR